MSDFAAAGFPLPVLIPRSNFGLGFIKPFSTFA
jgi:hypothetical protein